MWTYVFLLAITFIFGGCYGCRKSEAKADESRALALTQRFFVDEQALLKPNRPFIYKSELNLTLWQGEESQENYEVMEITGVHPRMLLKKRIDDYHFFELFKEDDNYLVKNQGGEYRKGANNHMYKQLFNDGLNLINWFVEQFLISDKMMTKNSQNNEEIFYIKDAIVSEEAPFIKNLKLHPSSYFAKLQSSVINGVIRLDEQTKLPKSANFELTIDGQQQHAIKIKAFVSLDTTAKSIELSMPTIKEDQPIGVPVNIAPRFNELLGLQ